MNGKIIALFLVACGLAAGIAMYWLQVFAFYEDARLVSDGGFVEMRITAADGSERELSVTGFRGIDAESSPIRFRACFDLAQTPEETFPYADAVPLVAPGWFECFDAEKIGEDIATGRATAVLGQANITYGIDRILAIYPNGRAFAWHQINACGEVVFDGDPPPPGCPPVPSQ